MLPESTIAVKIAFNTFTVLLSSILVYVGVNIDMFLWFAILLSIDFITGLMKARAIKESITSNKMKYGVLSKFAIIIVPIVLAIGEKALGASFADIISAIMMMLVLSEIYSILSNVYAMKYHVELPEYDVLALILKKIRNILLNISEDKPDANS